MTLYWTAVAIIAAAFFLTWASMIVDKAADRRIDRDFDRAGVRRGSPYGPVQKYGTQQPYPFVAALLDDLLEQALLEGIEQDERNEAAVEELRADLDAWGESA